MIDHAVEMVDSEAKSELRIAVVGAGFSGLAAALRLRDLAAESGRRLIVVVFEASERLGGLVQTEARDGYLVERGADSFVTNKRGGVELCRRLGLESKLIGTNPAFRKSFILKDGRPVETPRGYQLIGPTQLWPLLTSPLLSWTGKLRVAIEPFIRKQPQAQEESLAGFTRRRFGAEALDRIVQPMVGGIYTSDPEKLSLAAALPRFAEFEQLHGSVTRGLKQSLGKGDGASGARYGLFATLPGGMSELFQAAAAEVSRTSEIRLTSPVTALRPTEDRIGWMLNGTDRFDVVVLALPAYRSAELVSPWNAGLADELNGIEYASSAIVVSGHSLADVQHPLNGAGLVIPHIEGRRIIAVSFASRKFPGRAPEGRVLLRTFVGGAMQPEMMNFNDAELQKIVLEELKEILGVSGSPDFCETVRYDRGMPQYHLGHLERIARVETAARQENGFALSGNAYRGVGVPDAIESGVQAAEKVWNDIAPLPSH